MYEFCFTINGIRHCFELPLLIDRSVIKRPPPNNFPQLELAATVLQLVEVVGNNEFSKSLAAVATRYIEDVQKALPKGVELMKMQQAGAAH